MKNPTEQEIDDFICEISIEPVPAGNTMYYMCKALLKNGLEIWEEGCTEEEALIGAKDQVAEILESQ
jgi:hypothetical protein